MREFATYLYEVKKGTKPAALVTCLKADVDKIIQKLEKEKISHTTFPVSDLKVNVFFGAEECIKIIDKFLKKPLHNLTPLEDFLLGIILGYDVKLECKRLLMLK